MNILHPRTIDISGRKFNKLTVLEFAGYKKQKAYWHFRCDCGKEIVTDTSSVMSGKSKSCGCFQKEQASAFNRKHGRIRTKEYRAWQHMRRRCREKSNKGYPNYGGRGIDVCDRWYDSFQAFFDDMGLAPSPAHSLDRIDNNGNYCPENCRWANRTEQNQNKRSNRHLTINGETLIMEEWARKNGLSGVVVRGRIRLGWPPHLAVSAPKGSFLKDLVL